MDGHSHIHTTLHVVLCTVVFRRDLVQVSAGSLAFSVFYCFPHFDHILPNSYLFTIGDYLSISFDTIHAVGNSFLKDLNIK